VLYGKVEDIVDWDDEIKVRTSTPNIKVAYIKDQNNIISKDESLAD